MYTLKEHESRTFARETPMRTQPPAKTRRTQQRIAKNLGEMGFVLPGTLTERMMRCGKGTCRCKDDPPQLHGPYNQWTRTVEGKTVTKLLNDEQLDRYRPWLDNAQRLRALVTELETVSIEAILTAEGWKR